MKKRNHTYFLALGCLISGIFSSHLYAGTCEQLVGPKTPPAGAISAQVTSASVLAPNDAAEPTGVEHCRVYGVIKVDASKPNSRIEFLLRLPTTTWNHRLIQVGQGGLGADALTLDAFMQSEIMNLWPIPSAIGRGYATLSDDSGHAPIPNDTGTQWAQDNYGSQGTTLNPTKVNFAGRALHLTNVLAKSLIQQYYGQPTQYSYFIGFSTGGWQGLRAAAIYPNDYNGILVSAPGSQFTEDLYRQFWQQKILRQVANLTSDQLSLITQKVLNKCDALDGITDGILNDPRKCTIQKFNPLTDLPLCLLSQNQNCLSLSQILTLVALYAGPLVSNTTQGMIPSSEGPASILGPIGGAHLVGWNDWFISKNPLSFNDVTVREFTRYFMFGNTQFDWEKYLKKTSLVKIYSDLNATFHPWDYPNVSFTQFKNAGGKMLIFQGWLDPQSLAKSIIDLYDQTVSANGGLQNTQNFMRLYMKPGVGHYGDGPGPQLADNLGALEQWVEHGVAPNAITAYTLDILFGVPKSRPLCPYPKIAKIINAQGNTFDASNFTCANP